MKNDFNVCPMCAGKNIKNLNNRKWFCNDCGFDLYCNVAAAVGVIIFDDENNAHLSYLFSQPFFKEYSSDLGSVSKFLDIVVTTLNNCYPCFEAIRAGELVDLNTVDLFMCEPVVCA